MIGLDNRLTSDAIDDSDLSATLILRTSDIDDLDFDALCIASDVRLSVSSKLLTAFSSSLFCELNDLTTAGRYDTTLLHLFACPTKVRDVPTSLFHLPVLFLRWEKRTS